MERCLFVSVCVSMCCLRCVVCCRRCVGCCVVMTVQKDQNNICNYRKKSRDRIYFHYGLKLIRKNKAAFKLQSLQFFYFEKINLHHVKSVIIFAGMVSLFISVFISSHFSLPLSLSCRLSLSVLNDDDNDRSSSWLSLHTWP